MSTMTSTAPDPLEEAIRDSGEGWLLDYYVPRTEALNHVRGTIDLMHLWAQTRGITTINEGELIQEYHRNPHRVRALFQALGGTRSPEMLVMVWRVVEGMEIARVSMQYERQQDFRLEVELKSPQSGASEMYRSDRIRDAALLRHFGIMEVGGRPFFDGIYPLRTS